MADATPTQPTDAQLASKDSADSVVLSAQKVSKIYSQRSQKLFGGTHTHAALNEVSVEVGADETLAVIGDSGSGKTTLTRILLGLIPPSSGEVFFRGKPLSQTAVRKSLRASSGVIFQNPATSFDPRWTIERSIAEPLRLQHPEWDEETRRAAVWQGLEYLGLNPSTYASRFPVDLSGGQIQRAAFARAVVNHPAVLLADEPMSAIDMPTRLMVVELLKKLHDEANAQGREMATIIVSHDLGVVQHLASRVIVVHEGEIIETGTASEILNHPQCEYTQHLVDAAAL